jgi:hypothetical protein
MKRDVKSLLSILLAAMDHPSTSNVGIPLKLSMDVCGDSSISDSTLYAIRDSMSVTDGIPLHVFLWHE